MAACPPLAPAPIAAALPPPIGSKLAAAALVRIIPPSTPPTLEPGVFASQSTRSCAAMNAPRYACRPSMTPSEHHASRASGESARIQVHQVGEVTKHGPCWRLLYSYCKHTQDFALEGLEDPQHLVRFVQRYFAECLTCDLIARLSERSAVPSVPACTHRKRNHSG
jgi:hypothetical protein